MEAADREDLVVDAGLYGVAPNNAANELLNVGQEDNMQGQVSSLLSCAGKKKQPVNLSFLVKDNTLLQECDTMSPPLLLSKSCIAIFLLSSSDGGVSGPAGRVQ